MPLSHQDIIERSQQLAQTLEKQAGAAEASRRLAPEAVAELESLGLLEMVVPTELGGHGLGVNSLAQSARIMGQGCVASAWTMSFLMMHSWLLAKFPAQARAEFFSPDKPYALAPAPLAPTGTSTPADGGIRITGRWEWATGLHHSDWVMVHAVQTEPEFATRFAVVPKSEVEIDDVWHTSGMKATGSDAVVLDDVFVPSHRTIDSAVLMFGRTDKSAEPVALQGNGMHRLPVLQVLALSAAGPALGGAERAVELFRERISARVLAYTLSDKAIEQPAAQIRLGAAMAELASARALWDGAVETLNSLVGAEEVSVEQRMTLRLAAAQTVKSARLVINTIAEGAGASVYFESSQFQRIQRDVEVLKGHVVFDWDRTTELAGKVALELPVKPTDMI